MIRCRTIFQSVVECCKDCNGSFALHEEYLACFIACVLAGSTSPNDIGRPKVSRILRDSPVLAARIAASLAPSADCDLIWIPEIDRVRTVLLKLALGHVAHQLNLPRIEEPESFDFGSLSLLSPSDVEAFFHPQEMPFWPEIGSRAFIRACQGPASAPADQWQIVQNRRYQSTGQSIEWRLCADSLERLFRL